MQSWCEERAAQRAPDNARLILPCPSPVSFHSRPTAAAPRDPFAWCYAHPLVPLLVLVCAQVLLRLALSPALDMDEAEQIVWSQHLAWGYGVQPPLYTWLQWGVNRLLGGQSVLALSLLKHSLLALIIPPLSHLKREICYSV